MKEEYFGPIERIKKICFKPREFFDFVKYEDNVWTAIVFFGLMLVTVIPLHYAMTSILSQELNLDTFLELIGNMLLGLVFTFILIPFYHLFVWVFGGRNGIKKTTQTLLYGATPTILVSWIPIVSLIVAFYSMYVTIVGLKVLQDMKTWKAVLSYIVPFAILVVLVILSTTINYLSLY